MRIPARDSLELGESSKSVALEHCNVFYSLHLKIFINCMKNKGRRVSVSFGDTEARNDYVYCSDKIDQDGRSVVAFLSLANFLTVSNVKTTIHCQTYPENNLKNNTCQDEESARVVEVKIVGVEAHDVFQLTHICNQ